MGHTRLGLEATEPFTEGEIVRYEYCWVIRGEVVRLQDHQ